MDIDKVRAMSDAELEEALREAKQELWGARFALSTRQLKDYSQIPAARRTIQMSWWPSSAPGSYETSSRSGERSSTRDFSRSGSCHEMPYSLPL